MRGNAPINRYSIAHFVCLRLCVHICVYVCAFKGWLLSGFFYKIHPQIFGLSFNTVAQDPMLWIETAVMCLGSRLNLSSQRVYIFFIRALSLAAVYLCKVYVLNL